MPYISKNRREDLNKGNPALSAGELNFQITEVVTEYLRHTNKNYQALNDIIGALEGAKQEFYRRVVVPYEEQKRFDNGDVYDE